MNNSTTKFANQYNIKGIISGFSKNLSLYIFPRHFAAQVINLAISLFIYFQLALNDKYAIGNARIKLGICLSSQYLKSPTFQYFSCTYEYALGNNPEQ